MMYSNKSYYENVIKNLFKVFCVSYFVDELRHDIIKKMN